MIDQTKLVSHRLRGFGPYENSRSALVRACASAVPSLEVDTRVSADGRIFVYHHRRGRSHLSARPYFARVEASAVRGITYRSGEPLLEFEECAEIFSQRRDPEQKLCVDVKDFGFEREHLDIVDRYGLGRNTRWISWMPHSLRRLRELGAHGPLILAHCNVTRLSLLGAAIEGALARPLRLSGYVLFGARAAERLPASLSRGFQHGLICARLPRHTERLLADSGGGICVNRRLFTEQLVHYCRESGLQLWLYRVGSVAEYTRYAAHPAVKMVFSDNALAVLAAGRAA